MAALFKIHSIHVIPGQPTGVLIVEYSDAWMQLRDPDEAIGRPVYTWFGADDFTQGVNLDYPGDRIMYTTPEAACYRAGLYPSKA